MTKGSDQHLPIVICCTRVTQAHIPLHKGQPDDIVTGQVQVVFGSQSTLLTETLPNISSAATPLSGTQAALQAPAMLLGSTALLLTS